MSAETEQVLSASHEVYWRRASRLTLLLLLVWSGITFAVIFFARELSTVTLFGWPVSFYMAAQGAILIYLALVGMYAWCMRRLDRSLPENDHGA